MSAADLFCAAMTYSAILFWVAFVSTATFALSLAVVVRSILCVSCCVSGDNVFFVAGLSLLVCAFCVFCVLYLNFGTRLGLVGLRRDERCNG